MVKYKVVLLPQALKGLREITEYVRRRDSVSRATYVRKEIMKTVRSLDKMPEAHERLHAICTDQITYRRALQWSYRVIFTIDEERAIVFVADIDHGGDDPKKLLEKFK
ncbi:MAG: type II toxin-antitoxin system RelE/ParE family toxin [Bacteroidota bacterium]